MWTDPSCDFYRPILSLVMPLNLITDHTSEAKNQMQVFLYFNHRQIGKKLFNDNYKKKAEEYGKSEIYHSDMYWGCDLVSDCNAA